MLADIEHLDQMVLLSDSMCALPLVRTHSCSQTIPQHSLHSEGSCLRLASSPMEGGTLTPFLTAPRLQSTSSQLQSRTLQYMARNARSNPCWLDIRLPLGYRQL